MRLLGQHEGLLGIPRLVPKLANISGRRGVARMRRIAIVATCAVGSNPNKAEKLAGSVECAARAHDNTTTTPVAKRNSLQQSILPVLVGFL
jgi:hypothetical protein|mmetsp:Transcript_872/g.1475  ORF Transcript_872/g.1475 Transcript_872/m.1475 type:complete len:91 (-) Transcript_872:244-516(-)